MLAERQREIITENVTVTPNEVKEFYNSLPKDSLPYINAKFQLRKLFFIQRLLTKTKKKQKIWSSAAPKLLMETAALKVLQR